MQREVDQLDLDVEFALQLVNTPGTEVTPRSNVVAEHFQDDRLVGHYFVSVSWTADNDTAALPRQPTYHVGALIRF